MENSYKILDNIWGIKTVGNLIQNSPSRDSRNSATLMYSTKPLFVTVLPCDIPYGLEVLLKIREIVSDSVTYLTRHEPQPVTVVATRPPDLAPFFVEF